MTDPTLPVVCDDDERRRSVAEPGSTHNGIDWLEVDPADQRILHVGFLHPLPGEPVACPPAPALDRRQRRHRGRGAGDRVEVLAVAAADTVLTVTVDATGDFSPYTLRLVELGRRRGTARRLRPGALGGRRSRSRPTARATSTASGRARRPPGRAAPALRLSRPRRRGVPPAAARPPVARSCPAGIEPQPGGPAGHGRRGARARRRPPVLPPGRGRHRGVPRHRPQPRLGAPPRPPPRLRGARRLHRPGVGAGAGGGELRRGDVRARPRDRGAGRRPGPDGRRPTAGETLLADARRRRRGGLRDPRPACSLATPATRSTSIPGAGTTAALPDGRHPARRSPHPPPSASRSVTRCSWRRSAARSPGGPPTPTPRTARS